MTTLVLALYAEGRTDERFLPVIVQRTAERILALQGQKVVDVLEPISLDGDIRHQFERRDECVLEAARRAFGYHALIIHADADHSATGRALEERILPGIEAAQAEKDACRHLIPLIPVRNTEAWMLADPDALCQVIGTSLSRGDLGLPDRPHQVESDPNPMGRLRQAIANALADRPRRRRRLSLGSVYEPLAWQIDLSRLESVPAYKQFEINLAGVLVDLGLVHPL